MKLQKHSAPFEYKLRNMLKSYFTISVLCNTASLFHDLIEAHSCSGSIQTGVTDQTAASK